MAAADDQLPIIHPPSLHWTTDGPPESLAFGDIYFSKSDGLAETDAVFLQQNRLQQRFRALNKQGDFVIGETGFGSGLNFLAAWRLWMQTAPANTRLHFISVEKYPLTRSQLSRALSLWPSLQPYYLALLDQYHCIQTPGFHRLLFATGRVCLTLIIDDAQTALSQLLAGSHPCGWRPQWRGVDAWFLDGFAPAKNPAMWSAELLSTIAHLTAPKGTLATFSAASRVRRHLQLAGFEVKKVKGFGHKRQMIKATLKVRVDKESLDKEPVNKEPVDKKTHTKLTRCHHSTRQCIPWSMIADYRIAAKSQPITVLGAGLAGCHTARALADCGYKVTLIDRADQLAAGASGNAQGILYAKLSPRQQPLSIFNLSSLLYAQNHYRQFWLQGNGQQCGLVQLAHNATVAAQHRQLSAMFSHSGLLQYVSAQSAGELAGLPLNHDGLYFPDSGWLQPSAVCQALIAHPSIKVMLATTVATIDHEVDGWRLTGEYRDKEGVIKPWEMRAVDILVIANAADARALPILQWLPTRAIRGQVTLMPASTSSRALKTVICKQGYIAPTVGHYHCIGASFNLDDTHTDIKWRDHLTNLQTIANFSPLFENRDMDHRKLNGRVSFRCTTPDYLPIVGPAPNIDRFDHDYARLRNNARADICRSGAYLPGLYLNIGHGSRGLCYTPLCAAVLASVIGGSAPPLPQSIIRALNPARFIIRDLVRNRR